MADALSKDDMGKLLAGFGAAGRPAPRRRPTDERSAPAPKALGCSQAGRRCGDKLTFDGMLQRSVLLARRCSPALVESVGSRSISHVSISHSLSRHRALYASYSLGGAQRFHSTGAASAPAPAPAPAPASAASPTNVPKQPDDDANKSWWWWVPSPKTVAVMAVVFTCVCADSSVANDNQAIICTH